MGMLEEAKMIFIKNPNKVASEGDLSNMLMSLQINLKNIKEYCHSFIVLLNTVPDFASTGEDQVKDAEQAMVQLSQFYRLKQKMEYDFICADSPEAVQEAIEGVDRLVDLLCDPYLSGDRDEC